MREQQQFCKRYTLQRAVALRANVIDSTLLWGQANSGMPYYQSQKKIFREREGLLTNIFDELQQVPEYTSLGGSPVQSPPKPGSEESSEDLDKFIPIDDPVPPKRPVNTPKCRRTRVVVYDEPPSCLHDCFLFGRPIQEEDTKEKIHSNISLSTNPTTVLNAPIETKLQPVPAHTRMKNYIMHDKCNNS